MLSNDIKAMYLRNIQMITGLKTLSSKGMILIYNGSYDDFKYSIVCNKTNFYWIRRK